MNSGLVAERIAAAWDERSKRLAHRKDAITGVSEFPNLTEKLPERRQAAEVGPRAGLPRVRAAQAFEELRDRARAGRVGEKTSAKVYLATIGPVARHEQIHVRIHADIVSAGTADDQ